jgi:hypothetical protein
MYRVEKMLHAILDSRRVFGEWFKDDEDTLTGEFVNFMIAYGAEIFNVEEAKASIDEMETDTRLIELAKQFGKDTPLIRNYLGVDYDKIIGLLIEVVKEQEKRIKELENKVGS